VISALSAVLLAAACSDDGGPGTTRIAGMPVLEGATRGAGTPLGSGFTVAEGSVLLGAPFPTGIGIEYRGEPLEDAGWSALLLVTGEGRAVFDAYAAQAEAVGLPLSRASTLGMCADDPHEDTFHCSGFAQQGHADDGRWVRVELWRGPGRTDGPGFSPLFVQYSEIGDAPDEGAVQRGRADDDGRPAPGLSRDWPPLPEPGEPYEATSGQTPLRVPPGARLVAHPGPSGTCGPGGGSTAVFRLTGDPREVLDEVSHQVGTNDVFGLRESREGDADLLVLGWSQEGGSYTAWAIVPDDGPAHLMVDHCGVD
jgi:hypothetical protein